MFEIQFSPKAQRELKNLSPNIQIRIKKKLFDNAKLSNPLDRAKPLINLPPASYRFRIGKYRVFFYIKNNSIFIERLKLEGKSL